MTHVPRLSSSHWEGHWALGVSPQQVQLLEGFHQRSPKHCRVDTTSLPRGGERPQLNAEESSPMLSQFSEHNFMQVKNKAVFILLLSSQDTPKCFYAWKLIFLTFSAHIYFFILLPEVKRNAVTGSRRQATVGNLPMVPYQHIKEYTPVEKQ